jgi:hypothetical protein
MIADRRTFAMSVKFQADIQTATPLREHSLDGRSQRKSRRKRSVLSCDPKLAILFHSVQRSVMRVPLFLMLALILAGCGLSDQYTSIPVPAALRYDAVTSPADIPDIASIAKALGRLLFSHKPARIEISATIRDLNHAHMCEGPCGRVAPDDDGDHHTR